MKKLKAVAEPIIVSGFESNAQVDDIKGALFSAGVPFGKINSIFKTVAIEKELLVDPKVVTAEIQAQIAESDWEGAETYTQIEAAANQIAEEVKGAEPKRVLSLIRKWCKVNGISLPAKPKAKRTLTSRVGRVARVVFDTFSENPYATRQELTDALLAAGAAKAEKNASNYVNLHYVLAYALKNGCTVEEVPTAN